MTCKHENTDFTADKKRLYCIDCGMRMITPPETVYHRALEDSRRLKWHKVGEVGYVVLLSTIYIGAMWNPVSRVWSYNRVRWSEDLNSFELVQEGVTELEAGALAVKPLYIATDELGVPCDMPRLPSKAA